MRSLGIQIVCAAAACGLALPAPSASAADPVVVSDQVKGRLSAFDGNLLYARKVPKGEPFVCMRRVGGKLLRAHLPYAGCGGGRMTLDSRGRVVQLYADYGVAGVRPVRWYAYDVKSDRTRRVTGLPGRGCLVTALAIWRKRTAYSAQCTSKGRSGVWAREGKKTWRIAATSHVSLGSLTLRGGTLTGVLDLGGDEYQIYQFMVGWKRCVHAFKSPKNTVENEEVGGDWIANGNAVWASGYFPGGTPAPYHGLFTAKVPSRCAVPGTYGRFDFDPETTSLTSIALDGREVYYADEAGIHRHTLPARPSYDPPENDNFENATSLAVGTSSPGGRTAWATTQPGEPLANVKQTIWYTFTPATSGRLRVNAERSERGVKFGVYSGTSLATLTPVGARSSSFGTVEFDAVAGRQYWIDVGTSDAPGHYLPIFVSVVPP
jgi:hypothetical protein